MLIYPAEEVKYRGEICEESMNVLSTQLHRSSCLILFKDEPIVVDLSIEWLIHISANSILMYHMIHN